MATSKPKTGATVSYRVAREGTTPTHITFIVAGVGEIPFALASASDTCRTEAMVHGFVQRFADGAAKARDTKTGKPALPAEKFAGIKRIVDHYATGTDQWAMRGERVTRADQDAADTILAMTRAKRADGEPYARDVDHANAIVAAWAAKRGVDRGEAIKAWLTTKQVATIVADIRAERDRAAAANVEDDADSLMDEAMAEMGDDTDVRLAA